MIIAFIIGLFIGVFVGMFLMVLLTIGHMESFKEEIHKQLEKII